MVKKLNRKFFARPTVTVAKELLGKYLVSSIGRKKRIGKIIEVEAYVGESDLACHARFGKTKRTEVMYGHTGHAYIYLIYGIYDLLNIVTEAKDFPGAVLIRAVEPVGMSSLRKRGSILDQAEDDKKIANGPGKLTRWLGINRKLNGEDLVSSKRLYLLDAPKVSEKNIVPTTRIGVEYAGEWAKKPWRFYIKGNPAVSRK